MRLRYIDLFCGIGGFRIAAENILQERGIESHCVFSSDIDLDCQITYEANFHERPTGDITQVDATSIPDHDILFAGFPCQPFSIIGSRLGFEDTRGTLFFDIARILNEKRPKTFVLENVKQLVGHNEGRTLKHIMETLNDLGYYTKHKVLNALKFGVPQKRERIFIVGFLDPIAHAVHDWPKGNIPMRSLHEILESNVLDFYYASPKIKANRQASHGRTYDHHTIWHENKGGHISAYPYSCALRAGASYNYLLVDGERRLTEREMLRLQGFPDAYQIVCGYGSMRKLCGNSVAVPVVQSVIRSVLDALEEQPSAIKPVQRTLIDKEIVVETV
ncbi:MAG: DNA (cytosine-5-)-methyltransferase [Ktedonobacteraceae bacterium]